MKRVGFAMSVVYALLSSACSNMAGDWYRIDPLITGHVDRERSNSSSLTFQELTDRETKANTAEKERNAYLEELLARSEQICGEHLAAVAGTAGATSFGSSWLAAIFSGLATANPGAIAQHYSATSTVFNAGGTAFNANVYQGYVTPAILRQIRRKRHDMVTLEVPKIKAMNMTAMPAEGMRRFAIQYHEACSFYNGLIDITESITPPPKEPPK